VSERSFSQEGLPLVVAHRGASIELPENTLAAFDRAVDVGADAVEFDVRLTRDGIPMVMHDPDVSRTTDGLGSVRELTLAELKALRIDGSLEVPTLAESLRLLSGRTGVDVEIKNLPGEPDFQPDGQSLVEAVLDVLHDVAFSGPVLLSSFNPFAIGHARALAPEIPTGLLTNVDIEARAALSFAREQGHPWVLPFVRMLLEAGPDYVAEVHAAGTRVGTWIVDDPAEATALLREGVDAIATNDPAAIVAARREVTEA